jgi:predicted peroxiredoxin
MQGKKILVPLGKHARNLKSVHYALSLAGRIQAQIIIIRQKQAGEDATDNFSLLDKSLEELIDDARQNGVSLSLYQIEENLVEEVVTLANAEHIGLLVFNTDDELSEPTMAQIKPLISSQIIQVS